MLATTSVRAIQQMVATEFGVTLLDILADRRGRREALPRQVAMWLAKNATLLSLPQIGRQFGRDHTTVMHAIERIDALRRRDVALADRVAALLRHVAPVECGEPGESADKRRMMLRIVA